MLDHRGGQRLLPCLFRLNWSETHGPDCTVRIPLFIPWSSHVYWGVKWPVPFLSLKGKRSWLWTVEFNTHHSCVIWISLECGPWDSTLGTPKTVYWEPALGEALNPSQGDWTGVTTTPGLLKSKAALQLVTLQLLRMLSSALCGNRELKEMETIEKTKYLNPSLKMTARFEFRLCLFPGPNPYRLVIFSFCTCPLPALTTQRGERTGGHTDLL